MNNELTGIQHPGAVARFHFINLRQLPKLHFEIMSSRDELFGATVTISSSSAVSSGASHTSMD